MDFHGIGTEDQKAKILGTIDLNSLHIEFTIMQHCTVTYVMHFVCDQVLLGHSTPNPIHSDHACELIGKVMNDLAAMSNYVNVTTILTATLS